MGIESTNDEVAIEKRSTGRRKGLPLRVDYSARGTFIYDPDIRLQQCGLPRSIVLQLFRPWIVRRMLDAGLVDLVEEAEALLGRPVEATGTFTRHMWITSSACARILEEVIAGHPVLVSRAPSLNRTAIQAFQPIMTAGNVICIHPLAFQGFDSDQDGDQVTVHLPLSREAQHEASTRMMPANNLISAANGAPVFSPSRDIAMGCYYVTHTKPHINPHSYVGDWMVFASTEEVHMAYELGKISMHAFIWIRLPKDKRVQVEHEPMSSSGGIIETTAGRVLFNQILPWQMAFYNQTLTQNDLAVIVADCRRELGQSMAIDLLERITQFGLCQLTRSGLSVSVNDLGDVPDKDILIAEAEKQTARHKRNYERGLLCPSELRNQSADAWQFASDRILDSIMESLAADDSIKVNPFLLLQRSGTKGLVAQIRRLSGTHGCVSKPSGEIFQVPVKSSLREGLSVCEYFLSTIRYRKVHFKHWETYRRSRFLAQKLVQACRHIVVTERDCGTITGLEAGEDYLGTAHQIGMKEAILGRVSLELVVDYFRGSLVGKNGLITSEIATEFEWSDLKRINIRSPLTCQAEEGICQLCYGRDASTGSLVDIGARIGVIAAQGIGYATAQAHDLYRIFHTGPASVESYSRTTSHPVPGIKRIFELLMAKRPQGVSTLAKCDGEVKFSAEGTPGKRKIIVRTKEGNEVPHTIPQASRLRVWAKDHVVAGDQLTEGPIDPSDMLSLCGVKAAQKVFLEALRMQFSSQRQGVDSVHLEIVVSQMMRWLQIDDPGDSEFASGDVVDRIALKTINQALQSNASVVATGHVRILGIAEVAQQRFSNQSRLGSSSEVEQIVQRSVSLDLSPSPPIVASIKLIVEACRPQGSQSITTLGERTLLYTRPNTPMVGRLDTTQRQVVVPPEQWDAFWEHVDRLDVWSWTEYDMNAHDGYEWSLELQHGDRTVRASGRNAKPDNYGEFYRCLKQMVEGLR